ncbi:MAG: hypothetical protein A2571_00385 [Candidatus Vogelbacteria bacterium RIFOXYD1_FULL_44_32]|uniref:ComEC/Rec2-related protein domain-containing protein n=1 Tax=Candidatus Vogelbacteria bacterium RIFOXYD1_FULL_44_32 TaxID=1802438 RepID=A0A1G2QFJ5_9BACT|nr:MAG: hypothetical protein A2571_00385 [Candidatus Vogelbacteria bacterium RIFOXYD1_FULL_44_32]
MGVNLSLFRQVLFYLAIGFLAGVLGAGALEFEVNDLLALIILTPIFLALYFLRGRKFLPYIYLACLGLGFGLGVWRLQSSIVFNSVLVDKVGQKQEMMGVVVESPDERDTTTRLVVRLVDSKEKILVSTSPYKKINYGDVLKITGLVALPTNFITDSGREFDYISYLKVRDIHYQMSLAKIEIIDQGQGNYILTWLLALKNKFIEQVNLALPEPHSSLLAGLLVGERRGLGEEITTDFRRAGLVHIVVLSGYNMTIVAEALMIFLAYFLSFNLTLLAGAVSIILFALMVGGGPTVVRASLMALLAVWARATGRIYSATVGLFIAGVLMVLYNPLILANDTGFQLSFLATLGLIYLSAPLEAKLTWLTDQYGLRAIVSATLSAQLAVTPWLFYKIGEISLVALPANILVVPFIPLTMLVGFIAGILGFVSPSLAFIAGSGTYFLLAYVLGVVKIFSHLPLASVLVPPVSIWLIIILYLPLIIFARPAKQKKLSTVETGNELKPF